LCAGPNRGEKEQAVRRGSYSYLSYVPKLPFNESLPCCLPMLNKEDYYVVLCRLLEGTL